MIEQIIEAFELMKQISGKNHVLLKDLARVIKMKELDLMKFINMNEKLFHCAVVDRETRSGRKPIGLAVFEVYRLARMNYRTDEYIDFMKKQYEKYIHITEWSNYGHIQGHYVELDKTGSKFNYHLWRNTKEKIDFLQKENILNTTTFFIGGFGDSSSHVITTAISKNGFDKLKAIGWSHNEIKDHDTFKI